MNQHEPVSETVDSLRIKNQLLQDIIEKKAMHIAELKTSVEKLSAMLMKLGEQVQQVKDDLR
jgi:hypothetical protein